MVRALRKDASLGIDTTQYPFLLYYWHNLDFFRMAHTLATNHFIWGLPSDCHVTQIWKSNGRAYWNAIIFLIKRKTALLSMNWPLFSCLNTIMMPSWNYEINTSWKEWKKKKLWEFLDLWWFPKPTTSFLNFPALNFLFHEKNKPLTCLMIKSLVSGKRSWMQP